MSRVPYNPHNTLALISALYPQDSMSQEQTQAERPADDRGRSDLTALANYLSKPYGAMSDGDRL